MVFSFVNRLFRSCMLSLSKPGYTCISHIIIIFSIHLSSNLHAQTSNDSVYHQLFLRELPPDSLSIRDIKGNPIEMLMPDYHKDSLSSTLMVINEPFIQYQKIFPGLFERELTIMVQFQDTSSRRKQLSYTDTLSKKEIKNVLKKSSSELRGDNPTLWGKWIKPATFIVTGIGVIFALFYIRSSD